MSAKGKASALRAELNLLNLQKNWYWYVLAGVVMAVGGIFALVNPTVASLSVEIITGVSFIAAGVIHVIQGFRGGTIWAALLGVLALLLGYSLLSNPLAGLLSLTMVAATLILLSGAAKVYYAWRMRPATGWLWLMIAGVVSILLAIALFSNLFGAAMVTLGILLAIELLSSGILLIILGFQIKDIPTTPRVHSVV